MNVLRKELIYGERRLGVKRKDKKVVVWLQLENSLALKLLMLFDLSMPMPSLAAFPYIFVELQLFPVVSLLLWHHRLF